MRFSRLFEVRLPGFEFRLNPHGNERRRQQLRMHVLQRCASCRSFILENHRVRDACFSANGCQAISPCANNTDNLIFRQVTHRLIVRRTLDDDFVMTGSRSLLSEFKR
jgi:hypothetical protein